MLSRCSEYIQIILNTYLHKIKVQCSLRILPSNELSNMGGMYYWCNAPNHIVTHNLIFILKNVLKTF